MFGVMRQSVIPDTDEGEITVVRINTHGATPTEIEADKAIITNKRDDHKRRTVKLERIKPTTSWGFTLQSYGIYNAIQRRIENYTYIDYVDMRTPAFMAGMQRGDIIFAVDGQSTENETHDDLVEKIQACKTNMRMVLVHSNICHKVELHQRRQKLQALLRQKQSELKGLEKREQAIHFNVKARTRQREIDSLKTFSSQSFQRSTSTPSKETETTFITENNNTLTLPRSSPNPAATSTPKLRSPQQLSPSNPRLQSSPASPRRSPQIPRLVSYGSTRCKTNPSKTPPCDVRPKCSAMIAKLSLEEDRPSAYERYIAAQANSGSSPSTSRSSVISNTMPNRRYKASPDKVP